jgi:hypothetical protein
MKRAAKRPRRKGATETFSISVDAQTKKILRARADRLHGGNLSALITELGRAAERADAFDRLRAWAGGSVLDDEVRAEIDRELEDGWAHARQHRAKVRKRNAA